MLGLTAIVWYRYLPDKEYKCLTISDEQKDITTSLVEPHNERYEVITVGDKVARISCYNDSGTMANGEQTFMGAVAVSDRSIKLNSTVYVEDFGEFKITDRTNKRIHKQFGMLTIDIYSPDCDKYFGVKYKKYVINNL
jgi:3D (Asp-Asp-Asp) domain-containing protein